MDTTDYKRGFKNLLNSGPENIELARQIGMGANICEEIQQAWLQAESGLVLGQKMQPYLGLNLKVKATKTSQGDSVSIVPNGFDIHRLGATSKPALMGI